MAFVVRAENRDFGMKDAGRNRDRFQFIIPADSAGTEFTQAGADTVGIGQDQPVVAAASNEGVEDHGFKEREAECVGREGGPPPWMRGDQVEWR